MTRTVREHASAPLPPLRHGDALPIDAHLADVRAHLTSRRAVVLTAAPGAGKTTRVPPALVDAGAVLLLQPRRAAARAIAQRIAFERGWTLGREVGWHVRFDRRYDAGTRILVVTEGILTARLQHDPLVSGISTIVVDEFHERSVHADLGLALARQAWLARDDLRLVVMSATLDVDPVADYLGGCPVVRVAGTLHPTTIEYAPGESVPEAVGALVPRTTGQILCFLPGAREIEQARSALAPTAARLAVALVPLHGSLGGDAQDDALRASPQRRVILATNIAETSVTVPGVAVVVDTGQVKVARYDAGRGVDSLTLERVTLDAAEQRAGRAARQGAGLVRRLWSAQDRLRPRREPEIARVDLAAPVLALLAWGGNPHAFDWFESPPRDRLDAALALLRRLGAIEDDPAHPRITRLGLRLQRMPLHPRLARIALDGRAAPSVTAACALLAEPGVVPAGGDATTSCDLLPLIDRFEAQPPHVARAAQAIDRIARDVLDGAPAPHATDAALRHAVFVGYTDRLAKRRADARDRLTLASGHGATLARTSGVRDGDYLVALDIVAAQRDGITESRVRLASRVEPEWIVPSAVETTHRLDPQTGRVTAVRTARYDALVLHEMSVPADPVIAARLRADAWLARDDARTGQLVRRLQFAGVECDWRDVARAAAGAADDFSGMDIERHLPAGARRALAAHAPLTLEVPSGRRAPLEYEADGSVSASVKLQELFGLAASPTVGPRRVPVVFHLLAPNGQPVQTTRDLRSFWNHTYAEVRKQLRSRYPKHPWPEDPWHATPTHRTRFRR